ncbi:alanine--tRNA ligase [Candidatus Woesearchaeota archaeon]|nr:alanine--tRNA ligase [Candidatus Woesearchaeota archaeon]MBT3304794.1 alanine--tRNA ligase [Candidatus Woesearchaeota archaeon]MBT4367870.1 alanine--tRNA ligase [Candidatus Woesearchaeota archaeon]MBT4712358.1 alanine--tRNA ligase [Candidatus Woesearchaeota archaeon]MBT6639270.1 alanine--tRNA ligase [Candidatus Woesearchaeota archaeon]
MTAKELKKKYIAFFKSKGHKEIINASLIPQNDPTVLFTTAGMQPLVPNLLGQPHPQGKRLVNVQRCIRTVDIDEVGDSNHHTFFEMLGNWSLGDYWKKEAIELTIEFITKELNVPIERLAATVFKGDEDAPKDTESEQTWLSLNIPKERIAFLPKSENFWGPAGTSGPCGPNTEFFYWKDNNKPAPKSFDPEDDTWVELGNDVLMEYNKDEKGKYHKLEQKNIDFGAGVERIITILQGHEDHYLTELWQPLIKEIEKISDKKYSFPKGTLGFETVPECWKETMCSIRIIADHIKAATFIIADGISPSNTDQGYIVRRLIRRALRHLRLLDVDLFKIDATVDLAKIVIKMYQEEYPHLKTKQKIIFDELKREEDKFQKTLDKGLKELQKMIEKDNKVTSKEAFLLFQSYGFPIEMIEELAKENNVPIDVKGFNKEYEDHQKLSRIGAEKKFKGGLSESSETTAKLHTATHILAEVLRKVLKDPSIKQKGSNITEERLRYDFNFDRKLTDEEKQQVEAEVNKIIKQGLEVKKEEMAPEQAIKQGAQAEFGAKYPDKVSVYSIGNYSKEICMGPHTTNTKELGTFKIKKEESSAAGIRRIKAILI